MRSRMSRRARIAGALFLVLVLAVLPLAPASADPEVTTVTFEYTGTPQEWVVPGGVHEITIEAWGSSAYYACDDRGGYAKRNLTVIPAETLSVWVGGMSAPSGSPGAGKGGFNGGGDAGGASLLDSGYSERGSGGGGASDVRQRGNGLLDRVIVAGGAGGCSASDGGDGGGLFGGDASRRETGISGATELLMLGRGATPASGGVGGLPVIWTYGVWYPGQPGQWGQGGKGGASGGFSGYPEPGAGGGGGWFGGGGGASYGGGGGGSGYAPGGELQSGVRQGHGLVTISYVPTAVLPSVPVPEISELPVPEVVPGDGSVCTDPTMTYETYDVGGAGYTMYVTVGESPTDVEVCSKVTNPSGHVMFEDGVTVPKDTDPTDYLPPFTPPSVDTNAPDGEAPGSECTNQVAQGGSASNRAYVRTGSNADGEPLVCVGYRAGGGQGHVRVTVH